MFCKFLNMPLLWKFVTFVIKPSHICANNNPKLQNLFKKSEVASKLKALFIVANSSILDLVDFLDLSLLNYIVALVFTTNRPARNTRHRGWSKKFSERYSVYKSNLNRLKVW